MRFRLLAIGLIVLALAGCGDDAKHPLDDSETKPADLAAAVAQANSFLDETAAAVYGGESPVLDEWSPSGGCATNQNSPEQGEVSRILYRTYRENPAAKSSAQVIADAENHWQDAGHTVGAGSPNMAAQVVTRVDGISYSVVDVPPGTEMRAFLPCFDS